MTTPYKFDWWDQNARFREIFDLTSGHNHDGINSRLDATLAYATLKNAKISFADSTTCTVALSTIAATHVVLAQVTDYASTAYVTKIVITPGTGFIATVDTDPGANASLSYSVLNAS